jgi:hypothetical protein
MNSDIRYSYLPMTTESIVTMRTWQRLEAEDKVLQTTNRGLAMIRDSTRIKSIADLICSANCLEDHVLTNQPNIKVKPTKVISLLMRIEV